MECIWRRVYTYLHAVVEVSPHNNLMVRSLCLAGLDERARPQLLVEADLETELARKKTE